MASAAGDGGRGRRSGPPTGQDGRSAPAPDDTAEAASRRAGLEALAARRVPKAVPPAPGGVLPTTRRGMLRYRILPRSVIGVAMLILAFAVGAGFSGVVLYSYYQFHLNQTNTKVNSFISGYKAQFAKSEADLAASEAAAKAEIAEQAHNVQSAEAGPSQIAALTKQVAPSVFFVHTYDSSGQPSVGTAFVIASNGNQTLLLTSYTTIEAATHAPTPAIYVTQGDTSAQTTVTLSTWDQQYDLALLILPRSGLTPLVVAPTSPAPQPGDRLFAVSGLGSAGASLSQGTVLDVSSSGLLVDAAVGPSFQGGPVVNQSGQVVAVASRSYAPDGFVSTGAYFVPYVQAACNKVLSCPGGTLTTGQ